MAVQDALNAAMPFAEETGVELHLETSLGPAEFAKLLDGIPHPKLKVNYDSGNSASLGYAPADEFAAYGDRIGSVHIKDRVLNGGTVPLGTGDTDFPALFPGLEKFATRETSPCKWHAEFQAMKWRGQNRMWRVSVPIGPSKRVNLSLQNRVALVAGSSRGIGKVDCGGLSPRGLPRLYHRPKPAAVVRPLWPNSNPSSAIERVISFCGDLTVSDYGRAGSAYHPRALGPARRRGRESGLRKR